MRRRPEGGAASRHAAIPRSACWLLARVIPSDARARVLRDVEEMAALERSRRSRLGVYGWAWRQALSFSLRFGWERVREAIRGDVSTTGVGRTRWGSGVNARYALRTLVRAPVVTMAAVLCLAVGVALPLTGFSVLNALFLQPLPFPDSDRVVRLRELHAQRGYDLEITAAEYERRRERLRSYEWLAAFDLENAELATDATSLGLSSAAHCRVCARHARVRPHRRCSAGVQCDGSATLLGATGAAE